MVGKSFVWFTPTLALPRKRSQDDSIKYWVANSTPNPNPSPVATGEGSKAIQPCQLLHIKSVVS